jgi:hypothetical protein
MLFSAGFVWLAVAVLVQGCARALEFTALHLAHGDVGKLNRRQLQQELENSDFTLRHVDFSNLPAELNSTDVIKAGENPLEGNITITTNAINEPYDVPFGTFHLGPEEVNQIFASVNTQLVRPCLLILQYRIKMFYNGLSFQPL